MSLPLWLFFKWNIKAELARRYPKSPNLVRRMRTPRTTTRENQWGDNEEEEVSKAPEGPALGDYYSNGTASTACAAQWRFILQSFFGPKRVSVTDLIVFFFRGQQAAHAPSGIYWILWEQWALVSLLYQITLLTVGFILTLNICRWSAFCLTVSLALLIRATDMSGQHQRVIQLWYDGYDADEWIHQ